MNEDTTQEILTEEETPKGPYKIMKLRDMGRRLVIGSGPIEGLAPRDTTLVYKEWTGADEREIDRLRKKLPPTASLADVVRVVLANFIEWWGDQDLTKCSQQYKESILSAAYSADIFAAWLWLRIDNLDPKYEITLICGSCRKEIPYNIDLQEIEIQVPDHDQRCLLDVDLQKGFKWRDIDVKSVSVAPPRWAMYSKLHGDQKANFSTVKLHVVENCVYGSPQVKEQMVLSGGIVDKLKKTDIEKIARSVENATPGPDLSIDIDCPHCASPVKRQVVWEYDVFFSAGASSS